MDAEVLRYVAFADAPHGGNPAGLVLDAAGLSEADMLRIAGEVGYSETAFVIDRADIAAGEPRRLRVRYYSPAAEVPFCGHATVALASALAEREGPGPFVFATQSGEVRLETSRTDDDAVAVAFTSVEPATAPIPDGRLDALLDLLSLTRDDLADGYPPLQSFAGAWHPMLVLADRELFHQFSFAPKPLADLMGEEWAGTVTVLSPLDDDLYEARNLFPVGRITQDPATGSAAASTGAYLREIDHVPAGRRVTILQGAHVGRPSRLVVDIPPTGGITVSGRAVEIPGV
ncbi:PhzF family phenazine biosynthesis protein [Tsukamurella pseudospumae]|uniref:Phenazine biosynthesis protein PhzF n=1 Tax=Tsukamurella pseudospumae TaxID=239498 RepID=A0A138AVV5_9ACTN|nr:PhzF family phenazine biosynthesis protein [Tsukamurella pseudospumae]KXO89538.1 phenazine biosynthesis protein PhzF [Tsukamurella pseudospumae]KXP14591.1 phenazine biosynthesis protein PhzF [Tsukamurella pseudospumae]